MKCISTDETEYCLKSVRRKQYLNVGIVHSRDQQDAGAWEDIRTSMWGPKQDGVTEQFFVITDFWY
jgi:hypothetical protein